MSTARGLRNKSMRYTDFEGSLGIFERKSKGIGSKSIAASLFQNNYSLSECTFLLESREGRDGTSFAMLCTWPLFLLVPDLTHTHVFILSFFVQFILYGQIYFQK